MNRLNSELRSEAVRMGLCAAWQRDWMSDKSQQELIEMWKRGLDFGILHDYPSTDFIKDNFDRALLNRNLVFVDEYIRMNDAPSGIYVINGNCTGLIEFAPWSVATVYVRHTSVLKIVAGPFAKVFVRVYDVARIEATEGDSSMIRTYDRRK